MKKYIKIITIFCLMILPVLSNAQEGKKNQKAIIKTNIYCDHCKQCETCGKSFQSELLKVKGLKMMELDEKAMTITVFYDGKKTNLESIKTAIANLGYDADELKANPAAYEKLDGCCKKS
jgi:periplasmic mercuric ion binding protein